MKRKILGGILLLLGATLVILGIANLAGVSFNLKVPPTAEGKKRINVRLKWMHQAQFAGLYCADQSGYYAEQGIEVVLNAGGQDLNAIRQVLNGTDDIGVWGADQIMIARGQGLPVKAIGVVYQHTAGCFLCLEKSGIKKFEDIEGKRVGTQIGTDMETIYKALVAINGVDRAKVKEQNVTFNFDLFLSGQLDVWPSYVVNEPYLAKQRGVPVTLIRPEENGLNIYGDTLFCTEDFLKNHADLARKFLIATRKGWGWALNHPAEASKLCLLYDDTLSSEHQEHIITTSKPLIFPRGKGKILEMSNDGWLELRKVLKDQKLLEKDVSVTEVFNNTLLEKE
jgi:NitT/TauT family transport system substrate-binding protein